MGKKRVLVSYGVDIDAVSGWLGSYGGEDSASDISRGMNARNAIILFHSSHNRRPLRRPRGNPASP